MEHDKIFVRGNLRSPAEYFPVPAYFENTRWRLASNAVWLGVQVAGLLTIFVLLAAFFGVQPVVPPRFAIRFLLIALPSLAMALIFAIGSLDVSVGSIHGLAGIVAAQALLSGAPPAAAVLSGLFVALLFGLLTSAVVGVTRVPGFIATFVVSIVARQLVLLISQGRTITGFAHLEGIPGLAAVFGLLLAGAAFLWAQWPGGNARPAAREGTAAGRLRLALPFLVSAFAAGLSGILLVWRVNAALVSGGAHLEFHCLVVVALAGTCLYGRSVNIPAVLLSAAVYAVIQFSLAAANVDPAVTILVLVALLVLAFGATYLHHFIVGTLYRAASRKKEAPPA